MLSDVHAARAYTNVSDVTASHHTICRYLGDAHVQNAPAPCANLGSEHPIMTAVPGIAVIHGTCVLYGTHTTTELL